MRGMSPKAAALDRSLIVGGGIAGLALASLFARSGRACELIERAPAFAPVGAGIVLGVNAMRVMRMNTPTELEPSTGLDDVPAALPTGAAWLVAVTIPPH